jgi:hypothetical protein
MGEWVTGTTSLRRLEGAARHVGLLLLAASALLPGTTLAQNAAGTVRVYLDCQTRGCDFDHFRREIGFATWVRNREDAEVHVLVTGRGTGGGGREFTLNYIGRGRFASRQDSLSFTTGQTLTDAEVRDELTRMLSLGLVPFATRAGAAARLRVVQDGGESGADRGDPPDGGGWDYWVFRLRAGGFVSGESRQNSISGDGGVSANRVTDALKIRFGVNGRYVRDEYQVDEIDEVTGDTTTSTDSYTRKNWGSYGLAGWSIGDHWAAGGRITVGGSTFFNQDLYVDVGPTVEYNIFPYEESTRRVLAATLSVGVIAVNYIDTTIFRKVEEAHPVHSLELQFSQQQPWGSIHANVEWLQYWHDWDVQLIELFSGMEIRIVKGLSLNAFGSFARVRDQLYLAGTGLSEQEILTRQKARGTDYRFRLNFGLSYTFGATDNSIVNPRLDL